EIKKLEFEMWNLKVKGTDVDAIEFATELMDKKINTWAERQADKSRDCRNPPNVNTGLIRGATFVLNVVLRGISRRIVQN
ncbi:hypothetical protein Tco_0391868, partial [Tanacetum coccineum]